jgi:hypothetical protein
MDETDTCLGAHSFESLRIASILSDFLQSLHPRRYCLSNEVLIAIVIVSGHLFLNIRFVNAQ